jgi:hypothetical protein
LEFFPLKNKGVFYMYQGYSMPIMKRDPWGNTYFEVPKEMQSTLTPAHPTAHSSPSMPSTPEPSSEYQGHNAPFLPVNSFNDVKSYKIDAADVGKVFLFELSDENSIFAKRINPSSWEPEYETYDRRVVASDGESESIFESKPDTLAEINEKLDRIQAFIDTAGAFLGGEVQKPKKTATKTAKTAFDGDKEEE